MAWLWDSLKDFHDYVQPIHVADHEGPLRAARHETLFEQHSKISEAIAELKKNRGELSRLGFQDWPPKDQDVSRAGEALGLCQEIVWYGEELILYDRRLAKTSGGQDFLHQKDIIKQDNWSRYAASRRIFREIFELIEAVDGLLLASRQLALQDEEYLPIDCDLPESVLADFRTTKDLLSVGLDDICLLIAGRGLEGTLRHIAKDRRITLEDKGKSGPVAEEDFYNVIEVFRRLRWRGTVFLCSTKMRLH